MNKGILEELNNRVKDLDYVDFHGGLARVHRVNIDGKTWNLPLSMDVSVQHCLDNGTYHDVLPNDKFATSFFFLENGTIRKRPHQKIRNAFYLKQNLTLVGWFNCLKLGYDNNIEVGEMIAYDLIANVIDGKMENKPEAAKIELDWSSIDYKIPHVFSALDSMLRQNWSLHPYGFISIDFSVEWLTSCLPSFEQLPSLTCINFK